MTDTVRLIKVVFDALKAHALCFFKGTDIAIFQEFSVQAVRRWLIGAANGYVPQAPSSVAAALRFSLTESKR